MRSPRPGELPSRSGRNLGLVELAEVRVADGQGAAREGGADGVLAGLHQRDGFFQLATPARTAPANTG